MPKLDTLRIQYEHQVSSLQRQLEAERRSNQEQTHLKRQEYEELVSELRGVLGEEQQVALDSALKRLSHVHTGEIKRLQAEHQNDTCLELTALKLSLEHVYASKADMEAQENKQRYEQKLEALDKQHKEELNRLSAQISPVAQDSTQTASSLTDQYNQLIKRIHQELEEQFLSEKPKLNHAGINGEGEKDSDENLPHESPSLQDIHKLLQSQHEEIIGLKEKLQSGCEEKQELEGADASDIEQQLADLHKQYQAQVEEIQTTLRNRDEAQQREIAEHRERLEKQQEEVRSQYEKRVGDMEASFSNEISNIKEKYEAQISELIHSKLNATVGGDLSRESSQETERALPTNLSTPQQRDYIHKTMALTTISDTDSDMSMDSSRVAAPEDYSAKLKVLEAELVDRDSQLNELRARLQRQENTVLSHTDDELVDLRQKVAELQQDASAALSQCSELQASLEQKNSEIQLLQGENKDLNIILEEKNSKIQKLEAEKAESEKLYRDLLERESPRSKSSHGKDAPSGSSVDDSFASARDSIHNTPRSYVSDALDFTSPRSDMGEEENKNQSNNCSTHELSDSIPFANDSSDYTNSNGNNNNNNNSSSAALEMAVEDLKRKVEELDSQLATAKEREEKLRSQIEESEHSHKEAIEMLKQELEHEKKIEVETLQSEFHVQLEVELKRQAAQLCSDNAPDLEENIDSSDHSVQMAEANSDCHGANNNASPLEEPPIEQVCQHVEGKAMGQNSPPAEDEAVDPLLQTAGFELQEVTQAAQNLLSIKLTEPEEDGAMSEELMEVVGDSNKLSSENLSDDSKASTSASGMPSPVHSSTPMAKRSRTGPLTDIEKEMEALRQEYEAKFAELKAERDAAEERYDRLMQGVQSGEHPELNQLMKDKYDEELEFTKALIQQDFDAQLKEEKKKFVEKHRKLMTDFMEDREKEEEEANQKHTEELNQLRESLTREYEDKLRAFEQENVRLSRDLDLLRDVSQEEKEEENPGNDSTLPEIDEITLTFQEQLNDEPGTASPTSEEGSRETSTPITRPESVEAGVQYEYEESEEETEAERAPTRQLRSFADVVKSPSPASVQDMEFTIQQLTAQVERLTLQLVQQQQDGAGAKTPTRSPQHSPENDTLKEEDSALVAMLQSDLDRISAERESVQRTNDRLLSLLSDSVKTYVGVEDTINRRLSQVVSGGTPRPPSAQPGAGDAGIGGGGSRPVSRPGSVETVPQLGREDSPAMDRKGATPDADTSQDSHHLENTSILSNATDEGLEISQRLAESIFVGPDLDAEGEEILTDARSRLTTAVGQLLELMERSTVQLMEAKATQQELLDTLAARGHDLETTTSRCSELDSQLAAETQAKDYLGLELHKAEGLIAGYSAERESLESQLQTLEEQREALIVDLDSTRSRLEEFQRSQTEMDSARQELGRQQELLRDNAGQEMQVEEQQSRSQQVDTNPPALLSEVDNLNQEKRELAEQLQHQLDLSRRRLTELEALAEDADRRHEAQLEERARQVEDLKLQLENTERQLKASKAFVAEQMAEREQEREEHQREVERLEELMQGKDRNANSQQRLQSEIADLTEQLQARMSSQSSMHQRTLELQKALEDKELSAHDLKAWVAQLETELDQRGNVEDQLKQRITRLESQLTQQQSEEEIQASRDLSQTEAASGGGTERRGSSPTILSPKRKPWTSQVSLEEEVLRSQKLEEELQQENSVLKEQVQQQLVQMSGLRNQLDQLRHYGGDEADQDVTQLRGRLQTERDALERTEAQVTEAHNKIETLEGLLKAKEEEAEDIKSKVSKIMEIGDAQEENENLKSQLEELQGQVSQLSSVSSLPTLPPELLEEKNSEIQDLRQKLQEQETQQQAHVRELQTRLKERDEEISDLQDNITSLRRGEPCLDVSLPFNEDAGNVLNISMTGRTTRSARAVTPTSIQQELEDTMQEKEGEIAALVQEVEELKKKLVEKEEEKTEASAEKETKESEIYELTCELEELRQQAQDKDQEITQASEERDKAQEQLHEKDARLDQMMLQVDSLQEEISSLTTFQLELQKDFDTVQSMLDDKEKEIESLTKELTDSKTQQETLDTVLQLEKVVASLQKDLREKQNVVEEKEEELYELRDKLEEMGNVKEEVTSLKAEVASKAQQLQKEQKSVEESQEALAKERKALEDVKTERQTERAADEQQAATLQESVVEKDAKIKAQEEKINSLEKGMKEMQEKSQSEIRSLLEALEKSAADYEKRILSIEEQLKSQSTTYADLQAAADHGKSIENKVASLTQDIQDKESALESLQNKLFQSAVQHEEAVEELKSQLVSKEKDYEKMLKDVRNKHEKDLQDLKNEHEKMMKDLKNYHERAVENLKSELASKEEDFQDLRRQLKETEEQLRLRQSALLDAQAEKEQLLQGSEQLHQLKQTIEEKDQSIAELEGQLRFRQSCILDMEAERERVLEERDDFEAELRQDLEEKERALQDMQAKYTQLKENMGEEVLHMDQEFQRSSQARVLKTSPPRHESPREEDTTVGETIDDLKNMLARANEELSAIRSKKSEVEQRLAQTNLQLGEREEQLQQLQAEMQLQAEQPQAGVTQELEQKISHMEALLRDVEARATADAARLEESCTANRELETRLEEMKQAASAAKADGHIDAVGKTRMAELELVAAEHKRELAERQQELETVRQDLEKWIEVATGQNNLQQHIKDKENQVLSLTSDQDSLREKLESSEKTVLSLRQELTSKDERLADLQEQLFLMNTYRTEQGMSGKTSKQKEDDGESLSPETKQSISNLKMQLRKAQAALEEMRTGREGSSEVDEELERLRQELKQKEKELTILRSRFSGDELDAVKTLQDIREDHSQELALLQEEHDQDVRQLRKVQERKLEQALEELRQALEKEHKTQLNTMKAQLQAETHILQTPTSVINSTGDESSRSSVTSDDSLFPQRLQTLLKRLNSLGEHLLSVSDLEYLQQHLIPEARPQGDTSAWSQERRSLMDQIDALKDLLQQADKVAKQGDDEKGDWRSDLLQALVAVYERERRVLQAEVNTADSLFPEVDIITQLEARLHDLEQVHQSGLDDMLSADRQSLLDEVDSLHHQLLEARAQLQDARDSLDSRISQLEDAKSSAEWKLQRQIELLEYKLQQEAVVQEDLRKSLRLERSRVSELSQQSSRERAHTLELQAELSETQIGLSKARDALEREQQRFSSVTDALEEERAKTNRLAELLESAKRRLSTVEEDVAHADARYLQRSNSEEEYIQELKSQLTRERQRSVQFSEAEEQAKGQVVQLTDTLEHLKAKVTALRDEYEAKIEAIQREHMDKEMREQRSRLDAEDVSKLTQLLDEERESHQATLEQEKELTRQLRRDADRIRLNHSQQLRQLESENTAQVDKLRQELTHTRAELAERTRRAEALEAEEETGSKKRLRLVERDREELRHKVTELEQELAEVQERARQLESELEARARSQQQAQDSTDARARHGHRQAVATLLTASVVDQELKLRLSQCCNKLQSLASQLQEMTSKQQQRSKHVEDMEDDALDHVMSELDRLREEIRDREQLATSKKTQNGDSETTDSDQVAELIKHNQQLAERVLRLRQDKEHLTNSLSLLEERIKANGSHGKKGNMASMPQYVSDVTSDEETVYDRAVWASERLNLQMALDSAEHEIQRLRAELQHFRKFMNADGQLITVDHEKTTRLYGKFLRAESFRKALVYQKKYLLLLLGGYRDTEQETLAILASMGGFPSPGVGLGFHGRHSRAFTIFRSAGRTVIAIFRMKYLVRKWKRATRVGSPVMTGQISHQHGYIPSTSSFPAHQRRSDNGPQRSHRRHPPPTTMTTSAYRPISNNSNNSSSNSIDCIDSLSNGDVSTLTSNLYAGAARASPLNYSTPPTKDFPSRHTKNAPRGNREDARRRIFQNEIPPSPRQPSSARSRQSENDDDNFLHYLEKVKEQLSDRDYDTSSPSARRTGWR